jgi:hypothetical protein
MDCCFFGLAELLNGLDDEKNNFEEVDNRFTEGLKKVFWIWCIMNY